MNSSLVFNVMTISVVAGVAMAGEGRGLEQFPLLTANMTIEIEPSAGSSLSVSSQRVWAHAYGVYTKLQVPGLDCDCGGEYVFTNGGSDFATSSVSMGYQIMDCNPYGLFGASSSVLSAGGGGIHWEGSAWSIWVREAFPDTKLCPTLVGAAHGFGFSVEFSSTGDVVVPPAPCPPMLGDVQSRVVSAYLYCVNGQLFGQPSYVVQLSGQQVSECASQSMTLPSGAYTLDYTNVIIDDAVHDVTGDARFNQDDVDFLASIVGTPAARDDLYTSRFDFDESILQVVNLDEVDDGDIEILQCFVDACLDSRRVGDVNCDNVVDCLDLLIAGDQPFSGEMLGSVDYKVALDVDLDGDNDIDDKQVVRNVFLAVELSNFSFDTSLDFFDTSEFLALYGAMDPLADINDDGDFNFFDVSEFLVGVSSPACLSAGTP